MFQRNDGKAAMTFITGAKKRATKIFLKSNQSWVSLLFAAIAIQGSKSCKFPVLANWLNQSVGSSLHENNTLCFMFCHKSPRSNAGAACSLAPKAHALIFLQSAWLRKCLLGQPHRVHKTLLPSIILKMTCQTISLSTSVPLLFLNVPSVKLHN